MRLILASQSPRRKELLRAAGFDFEVRMPNLVEIPRDDETPREYACRLAREKALVVASAEPPGRLVLGADTVVVLNGCLLEKPQDAPDARRMLAMLSGRTHCVITGVCLARAKDFVEACEYESTEVTFRTLGETEIAAYVASGEPFDKAGAYGIQGLASKFVSRINGCYFNVVGMPVSRVYGLLKRASEKSSLQT
jgi:nucleoside triphosphate pyrophosphatase